MTSIITNVGAMVALQNLGDVARAFDETQAEVSTGLRISKAQDSSAYWAVAAVARSDVSALSSTKATLEFGAAVLDVTYEGLDKIRHTLVRIKQLLISVRQVETDYSEQQTELDGLQNDLLATVRASTFNGVNLLSNSPAAASYNPTFSTVAGVHRTAGTVEVSTIDVDLDAVRLYDPSFATATGILDRSQTFPGGFGAFPVALYLDVLWITNSDQYIEEAVALVDETTQKVIGAQAIVGTARDRIANQRQFNAVLEDAYDRAIGTMVDADMEEASMKLRAQQAQYDLAMQALAIANAGPLRLLSLFEA